MTFVMLARRLVGGDLIFTGWRFYMSALERYPGRTHALNTCLVMGGGDVIAQLLLERRTCRSRDSSSPSSTVATDRWSARSEPYDFARSFRFCLVGLAMAGPLMHVWYRALDRVVRGTGMASAVRKTLADQVLFLPVYLSSFVTVMGIMRGDRLADIGCLLRRDMGPMLLTSYVVWPAVQLINFRFIPPCHRILVINFVCLFWNTYIAWQTEKQLKCSTVKRRKDSCAVRQSQ